MVTFQRIDRLLSNLGRAAWFGIWVRSVSRVLAGDRFFLSSTAPVLAADPIRSALHFRSPARLPTRVRRSGKVSIIAQDAPLARAWIASAAGGALCAAALGSILRGHYFAIGTIAVVEVMREIANNWEVLTGGAIGMNVPILAGSPRAAGLFFYFAMWVLAVITFAAGADREFEVRLRPALHPAKRERREHGRHQRVPAQGRRLRDLGVDRIDGRRGLRVDGGIYRAEGRVQRPALDRGPWSWSSSYAVTFLRHWRPLSMRCRRACCGNSTPSAWSKLTFRSLRLGKG